MSAVLFVFSTFAIFLSVAVAVHRLFVKRRNGGMTDGGFNRDLSFDRRNKSELPENWRRGSATAPRFEKGVNPTPSDPGRYPAGSGNDAELPGWLGESAAARFEKGLKPEPSDRGRYPAVSSQEGRSARAARQRGSMTGYSRKNSYGAAYRKARNMRFSHMYDGHDPWDDCIPKEKDPWDKDFYAQ